MLPSAAHYSTNISNLHSKIAWLHGEYIAPINISVHLAVKVHHSWSLGGGHYHNALGNTMKRREKHGTSGAVGVNERTQTDDGCGEPARIYRK